MGSAQLQRLSQGFGYLTVTVLALDAPGHLARVGGSDDQSLGHLVLLASFGQGAERVIDRLLALDHAMGMHRLVERLHHIGSHPLGLAVGARDVDPEVVADRRQVLFRRPDQAVAKATDQAVEAGVLGQGPRDIEEHPLDHGLGDDQLPAVVRQGVQAVLQRAAGAFRALQSTGVAGPLLGDAPAEMDGRLLGARGTVVQPQVEAEIVEVCGRETAGGFFRLHEMPFFLAEFFCPHFY